ncbi:MAG: histidine phosphatase family protein [Rhizobiaceae bacterium]|nr:histidine phosphatase family protein [Rhizobiaceae bacterium]
MSRLYLLRHAKARWASPGMRDFDRPLDDRGQDDSEKVGSQMTFSGYVPDVTLCSSALRARQTLQGVASQADTGRIVFCEKLYSEDAAGYLKMVQDHGRSGSILVVGHNPMMEDLATAVSGDGDPSALALLGLGFPTAGLAVISFRDGLATAKPGSGYLEAFLVPAAD